MFITPQDAERRLGSTKNIVQLTEGSVCSREAPESAPQETIDKTETPSGGVVAHIPTTLGRGPALQVPSFLRATMGALAQTLPTTKIADAFGVSQQAVSAYKHGKTSPSGPPNPELVEKVRDKTEEIHDRALDKLMDTLGLITTEKLTNCEVKDLVRVATGLSQVAANTSKRTESGSGSAVSVVFYAPVQRQEDRYKTLDV